MYLKKISPRREFHLAYVQHASKMHLVKVGEIGVSLIFNQQ